ncbi:hypothetical protein SLEP1_g37098 [Rubroshorea leprosula]|nr:hypothetical protein SLEP1_g37098 [Rubroshorea leprosula]
MLCIEFLSIKISEEARNDGWNGSKIGKMGPTVSHLFFADDLIFIGKASMDNAVYLDNLLKFFCDRSSQKINFAKSKILFSCNVSVATKLDICSKLSINETFALGKYLGFSITPKRLSKTDCLFIVDKVRTKLAGWKANMLSRAGRITLASSVLSAIPNYYMQGIYLLEAVHKELDYLSRQFIWGTSRERRRPHLVSWERITQPKKVGGLGLRSSKEANQASMAKAHWRLLTEKDKLCHILMKGIKWIPRSGDKILFWSDNWVGNRPLNEVLYGPFSLNGENLRINEVIRPSGEWDWDSIEYPLPEDIKSKIKAITIQSVSQYQDGFCWGLSSNGLFQTKSAYYLAKNIPNELQESWLWVWNIHSLPKNQHFIWQLRHGKLLTKEVLFAWGIADSDLCPRCQREPESLNHLFRECPYSNLLWDALTPFPINAMFLDLNFADWLRSHSCLQTNVGGLKWNTIFSFIIWSLWYLRNQLVHEGKNLPINVACDLIQSRIVDFQKYYSSKQQKLPGKATIFVKWNPPPEGAIKLNTDGSAFGNPGMAGAGGVFRDHLGNWILGFSRNIGHTTSIAAKLWAIRDGLKLVVSRGYNRLILETDSRIALTLLHAENCNFHSLAVLISDCRVLLRQLPDVQTTHIYREANSIDCRLLSQNGH